MTPPLSPSFCYLLYNYLPVHCLFHHLCYVRGTGMHHILRQDDAYFYLVASTSNTITWLLPEQVY